MSDYGARVRDILWGALFLFLAIVLLDDGIKNVAAGEWIKVVVHGAMFVVVSMVGVCLMLDPE